MLRLLVDGHLACLDYARIVRAQLPTAIACRRLFRLTEHSESHPASTEVRGLLIGAFQAG